MGLLLVSSIDHRLRPLDMGLLQDSLQQPLDTGLPQDSLQQPLDMVALHTGLHHHRTRLMEGRDHLHKIRPTVEEPDHHHKTLLMEPLLPVDLHRVMVMERPRLSTGVDHHREASAMERRHRHLVLVQNSGDGSR